MEAYHTCPTMDVLPELGPLGGGHPGVAAAGRHGHGEHWAGVEPRTQGARVGGIAAARRNFGLVSRLSFFWGIPKERLTQGWSFDQTLAERQRGHIDSTSGPKLTLEKGKSKAGQVSIHPKDPIFHAGTEGKKEARLAKGLNKPKRQT